MGRRTKYGISGFQRERFHDKQALICFDVGVGRLGQKCMMNMNYNPTEPGRYIKKDS